MCPPGLYNEGRRADTWDRPYKSVHNGFTLIELMITVALIGILSMIALPIYSNHLVHAKRLQAEVALIQLANALENYFLVHHTYEKATLAQLALSDKVANVAYELQITSADNQNYQLTAIPRGKQAQKDTACAALLLNSAGIKTITGTGDSMQCWQ